MTEMFPLKAKGSPQSLKDDEAVCDDKSITTASMDDALQSINNSLERLQAINDRIHEQNESLIMISHALSSYRGFRTETAQYRSVRETSSAMSPAASSAMPDARTPIPFISPASSGKSPSLTEAEILAIHLNNIKIKQETAFFRNDGYTNLHH
ncbi:MAG: hypothetical protein LBD78_01285 [Spirochaetaceae bacterium]|nr:hypothetical protein [Spirochaetaceae bacterium]